MLLFHAPVVIAATAARRAGLLHQVAGRIGLSFLCLGVALFSPIWPGADLAACGCFRELHLPAAS